MYPLYPDRLIDLMVFRLGTFAASCVELNFFAVMLAN